MMDIFQFKGKTVEVYTDIYASGNDWRIRFNEPDGLIKEYQLKDYPKPKGPQIQVDYAWRIIRALDNKIQSSGTGSYYEKNLLGFYKATIPPTMWYGHFAATQAINGLIARLPDFESSKQSPATGYRCFKADGTFYQPVTFSQTLTQPDYDEQATTPAANGQIEITAIDGVGPFQYSINGGALQSNNVFIDLSAGTYTVRVEDAEGNWREEQVVLSNQFETVI